MRFNGVCLILLVAPGEDDGEGGGGHDEGEGGGEEAEGGEGGLLRDRLLRADPAGGGVVPAARLPGAGGSWTCRIYFAFLRLCINIQTGVIFV